MNEEKEARKWVDPLVAEIRAIRDAHARQFNYDIDAIFNDILRTQAELKKEGYNFTRGEPKRLARRSGTHD